MRINERRGFLTPYNRGSLWDFMSEVEKAFDEAWTSEKAPAVAETKFAPPVEVQETQDYFLLSLDLPGVSEKDIRIDMHDGRLSISGERRSEQKESSGQFRRVERSYGRFERAFQLPVQVQEDKVQARFENGVLEIMIPKSEQSKARTIQVETGKGGLFSRLMGKGDKATETKETH